MKCKNHCHDNAGNAQYERQPRLLLFVLNKKGLDCGRQDQKTANNQQVECNKVDGCYIGGQTSGVDVYERKDRGKNGEEGQDVAIDTGLDIRDFFLFVLDLFKFSGIDVGIICKSVKVEFIRESAVVRMGHHAINALECNLRYTLRLIERNSVTAYVCNTVEQPCSMPGEI